MRSVVHIDWNDGLNCHLDEEGLVIQTRVVSGFIANADYEEKDSNPMRLCAGDEVTVGPADSAWPGWVWARDDNDRSGYMPVDLLEPMGEGRFAVMEDFDPRVLTVRRGDHLESVKQIHGWHWCRNEAGVEGWVAGYLLRPIADLGE